mmetsp:Transcript_25622/g.59313  ORF Transcript_25622/g.59313 Transcript_25622/m.59313 type:complete len:229 (-) Transcript_25622:115-801(-)
MQCRAANSGQRSERSWLRCDSLRVCRQGPVPRDEHKGHELHGGPLCDVHVRQHCRLDARDFSIGGRGIDFLGGFGLEEIERESPDFALDLPGRRDGAAPRGSLAAHVVVEEGAGLRKLAPARGDFHLQVVAISPHSRGLHVERAHARDEQHHVVLARAVLQVTAAAVPVVLGAVPVPAARVLRARQRRQQAVDRRIHGHRRRQRRRLQVRKVFAQRQVACVTTVSCDV